MTAVILKSSLATRTALSQEFGGPFVPPDRDARQQAIGRVEGLSPILKQAFRPSDAFEPIPRPGPTDWLANHPELGQTFQQYLQSQPNRPSQKRGRIYFQPLGEFPDAVAPNLERLREFASAFYTLPVELNQSLALKGLPITSRQPVSGPKQLLSPDVLDWLKTQVPDDAYCLLAITMQDLYPDPKWNFVFGQASLRDRVGVYSFARYEPSFYGAFARRDSESLILQRSCKVLAHETGHMFGIKHCIHFHCLMNGSNHLNESDAQPIHLCPVCLRKLHAACNFDVSNRYEQLKEFSDRVGWSDENKWLSKRLDGLMP